MYYGRMRFSMILKECEDIMGLSGSIKIFTIGRIVYVPYWEDGKWSPIEGVVEYVTKGQIHVRLSFGEMRFSPNNRKLCLTEAECNEISKLLNNG